MISESIVILERHGYQITGFIFKISRTGLETQIMIQQFCYFLIRGIGFGYIKIIKVIDMISEFYCISSTVYWEPEGANIVMESNTTLSSLYWYEVKKYMEYANRIMTIAIIMYSNILPSNQNTPIGLSYKMEMFGFPLITSINFINNKYFESD